MEQEKEGLPLTNLKEYITDLRNQGYPNSKIIQALQKVNWPEDVIQAALSEADTIIPAVPEPVEETPSSEEKPLDSSEAGTEKKTELEIGEKVTAEVQEKKPATEVKKPEETTMDIKTEKPKKKFSIWGLVALLLSPIPFIGLGVAMTAWENMQKNNRSGGFFALLAMIVNTGVILFLLYIIYQLFMLGPDQMAGLADWVNKRFNLI
jgi:hypothetical protein